MESAARAALNQFCELVARRGRAAAATAGTFTVRRARHLSTRTTTGAKVSWSSLDERAVADRAAAADDDGEFRKADPPVKKLYTVYLVPTALNKADDVDVYISAAELHHSILSSVVGSKEEAARCMVRGFLGYPFVFSAMLTNSQARNISNLPGVICALPITEYSIDDPAMEDEDTENSTMEDGDFTVHPRVEDEDDFTENSIDDPPMMMEMEDEDEDIMDHDS